MKASPCNTSPGDFSEAFLADAAIPEEEAIDAEDSEVMEGLNHGNACILAGRIG